MAANAMAHVDEIKSESKNPERHGKQDKQLLETFWDLAATSDDKRLEGASKLIELVTRKQESHQKNGATVRVLTLV